jgi:TPR repeat protein
MRSPGRKRPRKEDQLVPDGDADLARLAGKVSYIISTEHKDYLTSAGPGNLRSDATACPRGIDRLQAETWLKEAVQAGHVSAACDGGFPRYAWKKAGDRVFEARLSNAGLGQYKGYPIEPHEAPGWLP